MSTVIFACRSLQKHIDAAQEKMNTDYPIVEIDTSLHGYPEKLRQHIIDRMDELPEDVDTVLMGMALCGGAMAEFPMRKRTVIPKADDCLTILLNTDDTWHANLKKSAHMYIIDAERSDMSPKNIYETFVNDYGEKKGRKLFDIMFREYRSVDIIDTGVYDSYGEKFMEDAEKGAELMKCPLVHVDGSNLMLEKLVSGRWDEQFIVAEPGEVLSIMDFNEDKSIWGWSDGRKEPSGRW